MSSAAFGGIQEGKSGGVVRARAEKRTVRVGDHGSNCRGTNLRPAAIQELPQHTRERMQLLRQRLAFSFCVSGASLETGRLVNLQNTDVTAKLDSATDDTLTLLAETF